MDIFVYQDELSSGQLRKAKDSLSKAKSNMDSSLSAAASARGYEGRGIFTGQLSELRSCISALASLKEELEQYAKILDEAPKALIETDALFKSNLSTDWERVTYSISGVLGLFSGGSIGFKTGQDIKVDKMLEKDAIRAKDDLIDDYRSQYYDDPETSKDSYISYSSKSTKTVTILPGSDYRITKYRDYKEISLSNEKGDYYANSKSKVSLSGDHYEIESNDGTLITLDTNSLYVNASGEFDPAKGNAYLDAGAEYDVFKATIADTETTYYNASVSAQVGFGAHVNAGVHDGKVEVDIGAAIGIGASVKVEFDYRETWRHIRSAFR